MQAHENTPSGTATAADGGLAPSPVIAVPMPWPRVTTALAIALVIFGVSWEWFLDPIRTGGSWMVLKVVPLLIIIPGLARGRMQTFRVGSLLIWIYVGEALVRVMSLSASERALGAISLVLSALLAAAILMGAKSQIRIVKAMRQK